MMLTFLVVDVDVVTRDVAGVGITVTAVLLVVFLLLLLVLGLLVC